MCKSPLVNIIIILFIALGIVKIPRAKSPAIYGKLFVKDMALKRIRTDILWNEKEASRGSPEMTDRPIRRPRSDKKDRPSLLSGPIDSNAKGRKVYEAARPAYLASFFSSAFSAAPPAETEVRWRYEVATVSATVTSHVKHFPCCHGI